MKKNKRKSNTKYRQYIFGIILGLSGFLLVNSDNLLLIGMGSIFILWSYREVIGWAIKSSKKKRRRL